MGMLEHPETTTTFLVIKHFEDSNLSWELPQTALSVKQSLK